MIGRRDGTTLVELLVVLAILVPIWGAATGLALHAARAATRASGVATAEATLATAATILRAELAEAPAGALLALEPGRVRLHAMRSTARWCLADSSGLVVRTTPEDWGASRLPVPGRDSVWLDTTGIPASGPAGALRLGLVASPTPSVCPDGLPGLLLPVTGLALLPAGVAIAPVVRTGEVIELSGYLSGGETWLGLRHLGTGELVQPVAGPFATGTLRFEGQDPSGAPASSLGAVATIRIHLETPAPFSIVRDVRVVLQP